MAPSRTETGASQKITSFFKKFTIPKERQPDPNIIEDEIIVATPSSRASTAGASDEPLYCLCRRVEYGDMVGCDNQNCQKQWFHYTCVGITEKPEGEWLCGDCKDKPRRELKINVADSRRSTQSSPRVLGRSRKESTGSLSSSSTPQRRRGRPSKSSRSSPLNTARNSSLDARTATSKKSPLQYNVNPLTGAADVTPTKDSPYREPSATPSKRRVALGVELSSSPRPAPPVSMSASSKPAADPSVIEASRPHPSAAAVPAASFSSTSTLSSVPLSSQNTSIPISTASSSKRVISGGLKGVTNSDSEYDDSDDDLADVSTFFANKKPKLSPAADIGSSSSAAKPTHMFAQSDRQREQAARKRFQSFRTSPPRKPNRSLSRLAAQHEAWQLSEAKIASLEQAVADSKKKEEEEEQLDATNGLAIDGDAFMAAAGSDDEQRERMIMALQRTEALHDSNKYYFFLDNRPQFDDTPFPSDSLPNEPWARLYSNEMSRKRACVSGFAAEIATHHPLPVAVTNWLAQQLFYERDEVLCEAYVNILEVASHDQTSVSGTLASLSSMYKTRSFFENGPKDQVRRGLPPGLKYLMRVVQFCAPASDSVVPDAAPSMTTAAFLDLAMINIDEDVKRDINLSLSVASCIESMLDELPQEAFNMLVTEAIGTLFLPEHITSTIRCRIISSLPAGTERAYQVRRRLALETFSIVTDRKSSDNQDWLQSISKSLQTKPEFDMSERTDYNLLLAMIDVLDIAVSSGFTPYLELHPPQSEPLGAFSRPPKPTLAAKLHNSRIDAIVSELNYVASRIRDAGTTHLRRTEVKSAIERVVARLECSVRTKAKPKASVFGAPILTQAKLEKSGPKPQAVLEVKPSSLGSGSSSSDEDQESGKSTPKDLRSTIAPTVPHTGAQQPGAREQPIPVDRDKDVGEPHHEELLSDREDSEEFQTCVEFNTQSP